MDHDDVPATPRSFGLLIALLVVGAILLTGPPGFAAEASPVSSHVLQAVPGRQDPLVLDGGPATKASARVSVLRWKQKRLYYYETIPAKWDWSLAKAVSKWNASGGGIKLTRTIHPSKAKVKISYGSIGKAAGVATIGSTRGAYVRLSSRYASVDSADAFRRIEVMAIFAHELGHVLGFGHTTATCSLMRSVLDVSACYLPPTSPPGYYRCRTIDAPMVRKFIRRYGGHAHLPSATWCLIDRLPPALTAVSFSGGVDSPLTARWTMPTTVPTGAMVQIRMWAGEDCTETPAWADTVLVEPALMQWEDEEAGTNETSCVGARLVNRFGAGRAAVDSLMSRWVEHLPEPVVESP
jgi:hypothetical protein